MEPKAFFPKRPDWLLLLVVIIGMAGLTAKAGFYVNLEQNLQGTETSEATFVDQKPIIAVWIPGRLLYALGNYGQR